MTEEIRDLLNFPHEIGQPLVLKGKSGNTYGRIVGLEGTDYHGQYPIVVFVTPHGSEIRIGVIGTVFVKAHLEVPDEKGMEKLAEFEQDALRTGQWYNGKLPLPDNQI
jgi:hypothetical protein